MFFKEIQEIKEAALKPELLKNVNIDRSIDIDRPLVGVYSEAYEQVASEIEDVKKMLSMGNMPSNRKKAILAMHRHRLDIALTEGKVIAVKAITVPVALELVRGRYNEPALTDAVYGADMLFTTVGNERALFVVYGNEVEEYRN
jgi:hypothetical protein